MKNIVGESFAKVLSFANDFKLSPALSNEKLLAISKSVYKKEYPLLVWKNALNEHSVINGNQLSYLNESVSDISTSFFLFLQGFYKPAQFILRSAIENFIKFLYHSKIGEVGDKRIDRLFVELKKNYLNSNRLIHQSVVDLSNSYSELSLCVHGDNSYISMLEGLSEYPSFDNAKANKYKNESDRSCTAMVFILSISYLHIFFGMHHRLQDAIRAALHAKHSQAMLEQFQNN